jgi:DNA sulfur modification protein DndD
MILDEIKIGNFRQYYGLQVLKISKDKEKNVTVIHGENGEGKTAFLNVIKWCLYNKIDLPEADRLLNERAEVELSEGQMVEVSVEITFEDKGIKYTVKRVVNHSKFNNKIQLSGQRFTVNAIDQNGISEEYRNPINTINQVLPEKMESYFFFDGEKIDNLAKKEGCTNIKDAIKNIMGIEVIENTIKDLKKVSSKFKKEFSHCANSSELSKYSDQLEQAEKEVFKEELGKSQCEINKNALIDQKERIYEKLRSLEGAKELQKQRDKLEIDKANKINKIEEIDRELKTIISTKGYLAFSTSLITKVEKLLETRRQKGEIPAGIKEQFVDDILERKICICGRHFIEGQDEYKCVEAWKKKSSNRQLEDAFIQVSGDLRNAKDKRENLFFEIEKIKKAKKEVSDEKRKIDEELDELSTKLDNKESEDIKELEAKKKNIEEQIEENIKMIGEKEFILNRLYEAKEKLEKVLRNATVVGEKANLAQKRFNETEDTIKALDEVLELTIHNVKNKLQDKINKVYDNFSKKGYKALLNENFELQIIKEHDEQKRPVPMSQGERQITSLCFIGALVDLARERSQKETQIFKGGIYPIVMDSPFGALDPVHKTRIAAGMPTLSHQVVILVTNSQWKGEVEESIFHRVGKEYKLINYNPKKDQNIQHEYTVIEEL